LKLDDTTRGKLEKLIDVNVETTHHIVKVFHGPSQKARFQIKNEDDFALGIALGAIYSAFSVIFSSMHERHPDEEERLEIGDIIFKRIPEIREAIFKTG
jgi:hypothetical protein